VCRDQIYDEGVGVMRTKMKWILTGMVSLALSGHAVGAEKDTETLAVNPNQVVVQVYGIV